MLKYFDRDQQHAAIAKFNQHENGDEREKVDFLLQQVSQQAEQLRELGAQQTDLLIQQIWAGRRTSVVRNLEG